MLLLIVKKNLYLWLLLFFFLFTTFNLYNFNFFLRVKKVQFNATEYLDEITKSKSIELILNKNLFFIDKKKLIKILYQNNWVKKVEINQKLPDTIFINITEYKPLAYYESNKNIHILNSGFVPTVIINSLDISNLIKLNNVEDFKKFKIFFETISNQFVFFSEVKELHHIYDNRWNVILKNNKIIKFGNYDLTEQIKNVNLFLKQDKIRVLDLRVKDRLVINYDN
jgi:cell division septal protein FtsQ